MRLLLSVGILIGLALCHIGAAKPAQAAPVDTLINAARAQVGVTLFYDSRYKTLPYPNGDVAPELGVCTDVLIRALRGAFNMDLQVLIHEDMRTNFHRYPKTWGAKKTDRNIDHRRVPNIQTYLTRHHQQLPVTQTPADYLPGDIVTSLVDNKLPHIMLVSNRQSTDKTPWVIHNIGRGAQEEAVLFKYPITGHYRLKL
jgi:uncharacterized protein YijF (DUF1287 family)